MAWDCQVISCFPFHLTLFFYSNLWISLKRTLLRGLERKTLTFKVQKLPVFSIGIRRPVFNLLFFVLYFHLGILSGSVSLVIHLQAFLLSAPFTLTLAFFMSCLSIILYLTAFVLILQEPILTGWQILSFIWVMRHDISVSITSQLFHDVWRNPTVQIQPRGPKELDIPWNKRCPCLMNITIQKASEACAWLQNITSGSLFLWICFKT